MRLGLLPGAPPDLPGEPVADVDEARARGCALVLGHQAGRLALWAPGGRETPLSVDFDGGRQGFRLAQERVRHERLVKAVGKLTDPPRLVDATAGLGRDASLLAQAGWQVTLVEQHPVLHALLADGLRRAPAPLVARMRLLHADSTGWLATASAVPVVFLDPMFPEREKTAAVKKELAWLQYLAPWPTPEQERALLAAARQAAGRRVVVKRPLRAPPLAGIAPTHQLPGRTVRFDVYVCS